MKHISEHKDILCNMCGLSCSMDYSTDGQYKGNHGLIEYPVVGGYPSTPGNGDGALDDMTQYEFSLCEFCLDFIFTYFKIPPRVCQLRLKPPPNIITGSPDDVIENESEPFVPAEQRVKNDDWRKLKREFFIKKLERDAARKIAEKIKS